MAQYWVRVHVFLRFDPGSDLVLHALRDFSSGSQILFPETVNKESHHMECSLLNFHQDTVWSRSRWSTFLSKFYREQPWYVYELWRLLKKEKPDERPPSAQDWKIIITSILILSHRDHILQLNRGDRRLMQNVCLSPASFVVWRLILFQRYYQNWRGND